MRDASTHLLALHTNLDDQDIESKLSRLSSQDGSRDLSTEDQPPEIPQKTTANTLKRLLLSRVWQTGIPALITLAPLVLLIAYSGELTRTLGYDGCLPSGEFVLPYTNSIWDIKNFFVVTIQFLGNSGTGTCDGSYSTTTLNLSSGCDGYSFTTVKIIDVAWDLLVGRGAQLALGLIAYRLFGNVLKTMMQSGAVGYDAFAAAVFSGGEIGSIWTYLRYAANRTPVPRTRGARVAYLAMAICTLYIVSVPTLLSAMTGYTSFYAPAVAVYGADGNFSTYDCGGTLLPAFGEFHTGDRIYEDGYWMQSHVINYDHPPIAPTKPLAGMDFIDCRCHLDKISAIWATYH